MNGEEGAVLALAALVSLEASAAIILPILSLCLVSPHVVFREGLAPKLTKTETWGGGHV